MKHAFGGRVRNTAQSLKQSDSSSKAGKTVMKTEKTLHFIKAKVPGALALGHHATTLAKAIKAVLICASGAGILIATASGQPDIMWQTPVTISGTSDVSKSGFLYGTWAPGDDWGGSQRADYYPVNGVTFAAYGTDGANFGFSGSGINLDRYNGFANPNSTDGNYNYLLQT